MQHKCILTFLINYIQQIVKEDNFWQLKVKSSQKKLCYTSSFLKGSFVAKKLDMELEKTFGLFLESCLSKDNQFILWIFFNY